MSRWQIFQSASTDKCFSQIKVWPIVPLLTRASRVFERKVLAPHLSAAKVCLQWKETRVNRDIKKSKRTVRRARLVHATNKLWMDKAIGWRVNFPLEGTHGVREKMFFCYNRKRMMLLVFDALRSHLVRSKRRETDRALLHRAFHIRKKVFGVFPKYGKFLGRISVDLWTHQASRLVSSVHHEETAN